MKKIYNFSFKGGVGKSTLTAVEAYELAKKGYKVLVIDMDPQANATDILFATFEKKEPKTPLLEGLLKHDLVSSIVKLSDNLYIAPADWDMSLFNVRAAKAFDSEHKETILKDELSKIDNNFDFCFIDTPPTLSEITNNALLASDYVTVVVQSQAASFNSAVKTVTYYAQMRNDYKVNFKLLGAILYLVNRSSTTDTKVISKAHEFFGDSLFQNRIYHRERIKRWSDTGITDKPNDVWDERTHSMYNLVLNEMLDRAGVKINDER
ncbi:ParA family protein (plasmid) [Lactobacillus sp. ESL0731]|uniref:ParA family protein n=1 Tax=unclassified Lactobacillus TaxID=2620435 RepID=UPI0023F78856|nr:MULTISPECIES: ParA family protein [unclassified Lactobacillus]WEV52073.1 ParA family protein [Lactobacillus sp. ESL0700]WEV63236.1 ParA family protein [Lactobacillus sp. ESL0731]